MLYGMCFFCVKFAVYAMLLWMPMFLEEQMGVEDQKIANIETLYEVGTVVGAIILGLTSDKCGGRRSPIAMVAVICGFLISLSFFAVYKSYPTTLWLIAMFFFGFFLGSLHHLICITVSADLGRSHSKQATSTITGIIDGMGTAGSGIGQLLLGILIENFGWRLGFFLPITIVLGLTLLPLTKILYRELSEIKI